MPTTGSGCPPSVTLVVPTVGRPSLRVLLDALDADEGPAPAGVVVVDDRPGRSAPLALAPLRLPHQVMRSEGRGPAAARNVGWRAAASDWVAFVDDDVLPEPGWLRALAADLRAADGAPGVAGTQGRVTVPLPPDRRPTDWERTTAGLAAAAWITADMAYRRAALAEVGGFDERFRRAYREDCDLALRVQAAGGRLVLGERRVRHPVRPAGPWVSVRAQAGNADDVLMRAVHGPDWRVRGQAPPGRRNRHLAVTAAAAATTALAVAGRPRAALALGSAAAATTAEFAWSRIRPGPRTAGETATMIVTSALIPPAASWHYLRGLARHRSAPPWRGLPDAVLLDRDGTLVEDVPYNGDPAAVQPRPTAAQAVSALRGAGVPMAVVTNQSGVGRGLLTSGQVAAVNEQVERVLGPFHHWQVCPHHPDDDCPCRKPRAGLLLQACAVLGVRPERTVMIGDIGADMVAARAAGAVGILVPTPVTRPAEVRAARHVRPDLASAVELVLSGVW